MQIVFIISSLGSGGAERVLVNIANELVNRGYEIVIATFSNEGSFYLLDKRIVHKKLDLMQKSSNILESLINSIKRIIKLKKFLKKENPDVVVSFMTHTNILSIIAAKLNKQKIIISERIAYDFYGKKVNLIKRIIYPLSDYLILQTQGDLNNYHFVKKKKVIYNPLFIKNYKDFLIDKDKYILAVGRLDKQKGFDILIETYAKIDMDWKLFIVGEGEERENLQNLIKKLNLKEKVILLGRKKDIFEWYKKASIFVLSSKREGFPNVLIEAMAFKCAVVSFDCPYGPGEIIENYKNGLLVKNQDSKELQNAIELLIKNEELRNYLGANAIKVREKYNIQKIVDEWEKIIKEII